MQRFSNLLHVTQLVNGRARPKPWQSTSRTHPLSQYVIFFLTCVTLGKLLLVLVFSFVKQGNSINAWLTGLICYHA